LIPVFEPVFTERERELLVDCIDTGWVSSQGKYITRFEEAFAEWHSVEGGVACSNCTTALHLALLALGVGPGDEVICPALTFISPANMIALTGATPVLADIDPYTMNLDPECVESAITPRTKALLVVHQFGHAAPMDALLSLSQGHGLKVIEDNAEALGGRFRGRLLGTLGDIACFSFFANKTMTTGEGGMILTGDGDLARTCRILRDHGMHPEKRYHHIMPGFNYRMTNMQAAIGMAQLERLTAILEAREQQRLRYEELLHPLAGLVVRAYADWCTPSHWLTTISLEDEATRDQFIAFMKGNDIECRPMIPPVHHAAQFRGTYAQAAFPVSRDVSYRSAHLPSGTGLEERDIRCICDAAASFCTQAAGGLS
jgi:perosamine synthetase